VDDYTRADETLQSRHHAVSVFSLFNEAEIPGPLPE
jgi:hypothetical protein